MADFDIGINLDDMFDFSGNQKTRDEQIAYNKQQDWENREFNERQFDVSEQQRKLDNQFRQRSYNWSKKLSSMQYMDDRTYRQNKLQFLMRDAMKAGISPSLALGQQGTSPVSLNMPVGQGGRVSGNYQRRSPIDTQMSRTHGVMVGMQLQNLQAENDMLDQKVLQEKLKTRVMYRAESGALVAGITPEGKIDTGTRLPDEETLYHNVVDNSDDARRWSSDGRFVFVNPNLNLETPETIGGYYFTKPRVFKESEKRESFNKYLNAAP